jgi:hypothetical protein
MQVTAREGAATHRADRLSKVDLLGCIRQRPVPSLHVRKGLEWEEEPPRSLEPNVPKPDEGRNTWPSTAVRDS